MARRLQPLGTHARVEFQRPVRGVALATCDLGVEARDALDALYAGAQDRARFTTQAIIDGDHALNAAVGEFDWIARLTPG